VRISTPNKNSAELFPPNPSFLQHLVPLCLELAAGFPLWKFVAIGDLIADFEEKLHILYCAGEVPIRINFV